MSYRVSVMHGDGIGPEVIEAALLVLEATGLSFQWEATETPEQFFASLALTGTGIKGPLDAFHWNRSISPNQWLRRSLDLSVNVRPAKAFGTTHPNIDLLTIHHTRNGEISPVEYHNFLFYACEYAQKLGRKEVTIAHKPQFFKEDETLVSATRTVAPLFPDLEISYTLADTVAMQMVMSPARFDVLICNAVYGDIFSDMAAGFIGGRGFAPGANYNPVEGYAVFEAVHGTARHLAGQKRANPLASILSGALLLHHLGEHDAAADVEQSCANVIRTGCAGLSTSEITKATIAGIRMHVPGYVL